MNTLESIKRSWEEKKAEFIIRGIMSLIGSLVAGVLLVVICLAFKADVMLSLIAGLLLVIILLILLGLRFLLSVARADVFLREIKSIPQTDDDASWQAWGNQLESLLRGMGLLRKSQILRQLIERASPEDRAIVAENFLRGLSHEATFIKPKPSG